MIKDITDKIQTSQNTVKGLMKNIIDDKETRRIMVNVIDNAFNEILDGSLIIRVPRQDNDLVVSRTEIAKTSKAFTQLLNRFYHIEASEDTMSLIEETKSKQTRMNKKETTMESGRGITPTPESGGPTLDPNTDLLSQYLPQFTEKLKQLNNALANLDLSGAGGGGVASEIIDEAGDIAGSRRGGSIGGLRGNNRAGPRASNTPTGAKGGGGFGLGNMLKVGALIGGGALLAENAGSIISGATNFLSNTITTVAKKAEAILSSLGQSIAGGASAVGGAISEFAGGLTGGGGTTAANFIAGHEGFESRAYLLPGERYYTIGFGHQIQDPDLRSGQLGGTGVPVVGARGSTSSIDRSNAIKLLQEDLPKYEAPAARALGASWNKLNETQKAAFISYSYNAGGGNANRGTGVAGFIARNNIASLIEQGNFEAVAAAFRDRGVRTGSGRVLPGLVRRRAEEGQLILSRSARGAGEAIGSAVSGAVDTAAGAVRSGAEAVGNFVTGTAGRMMDLVGTAINLGGGITGNRKNLQNLDPTFERQIAGAVAEYHQRTGRKVTMTSGFRYPGDQARIAGQRGAMTPARPGRSRHERGLAMDFSTGDATAMERSGILRKYGLVQAFPARDPVHIQQIGGGSAGTSPPAGGQRTDPAYYQIAGEDANSPQLAYSAVRLTSFADMVRNASRPPSAPAPQPAATARLPTVAEVAAIDKKIKSKPKVVIIEKKARAESTPPTVTALGDASTPPKSNPDLATQYRTYFGVA